MQARPTPQQADAHEPTPQERSRAVRATAHHANDAAQLAELLDMLGLDPDEGRGGGVPQARSGGPSAA
ncbi:MULTISPECIES: hypothetical protein [Saccharopolyspora]|uniref:Uncharacterized protein n=1 Tax=Saccharopolyspora gregorii TaxID=33914 RepID=A0ABP6RQL4_9PSEU|nr:MULTISPECIES: hypothetical protein [Saccharopolyspora]MCA1187041.1 hypothetical protein [Saccharopolyspora sp. 6T]MCA1191907.1 hypothetical protein [Saccharopolyspora sp. 6V]MCA1224830.1 hypothetical protein [Saccharopolyspora sp. 6M]MCA1280178.1 hypothetical protein [Saccharopolyspora sp. 7B]